MHQKVSIVIEHDSHGYYAYAPELPGCHSQAPTIELVVARIKEAIELYLETLTAEERAELLSTEVLTPRAKQTPCCSRQASSGKQVLAAVGASPTG